MTRAEHLGVSGLSAADVTQRWLSQYGWSLLIAVGKVWRYVNTAPISPSTACKKCMWNKTEKETGPDVSHLSVRWPRPHCSQS